jgi:hypothetical protein
MTKQLEPPRRALLGSQLYGSSRVEIRQRQRVGEIKAVSVCLLTVSTS